MKKTITFILFLIVATGAIGFHVFWWSVLVPSLDSNSLDPVQGVWVGYLISILFTAGTTIIFYNWWRTGKLEMI